MLDESTICFRSAGWLSCHSALYLGRLTWMRVVIVGLSAGASTCALADKRRG